MLGKGKPGFQAKLNKQGCGCYVELRFLRVSMCLCAQLCPTLFSFMDCSLPGSFVHGIFRQEYRSGLPIPPPGIFQGTNPHLLPLLHQQVDFFFKLLSHLGSPRVSRDSAIALFLVQKGRQRHKWKFPLEA